MCFNKLFYAEMDNKFWKWFWTRVRRTKWFDSGRVFCSFKIIINIWTRSRACHQLKSVPLSPTLRAMERGTLFNWWHTLINGQLIYGEILWRSIRSRAKLRISNWLEFCLISEILRFALDDVGSVWICWKQLIHNLGSHKILKYRWAIRFLRKPNLKWKLD